MSSFPSNNTTSHAAVRGNGRPSASSEPVFWRVEGSLLDLTAVRPVAFFTWNAQSFLERWTRRGAMGVLAIARPVLYCTHRVMATRLMHTVLRGESRDRLDLLGEEFFEYFLQPRLKEQGVARLRQALAASEDVVLVSQGLEHTMRPLANHLGVRWIVSNRLEFRSGMATGRLVSPVVRPRGILAKLRSNQPDGRISRQQLVGDLGFGKHPEALDEAIRPAKRPAPNPRVPVVCFDEREKSGTLSIRRALRGKHILLIGATGFIGKVWLANLLHDVPDVGRVTLLIRGHRSATALERFERIVRESPVFDPLADQHSDDLSQFLRDKVEVVSGDATKEWLGLGSETVRRLARSVDVVINSSGLTDFNPDLRDALSSNVDAVVHLLNFLRACHHAALLHLSTCYVVGQQDGRILESLPRNYCPRGSADFDAEKERLYLEELVRQTEARAETTEGKDEIRREALEREHTAKNLQGAALDNQLRKNRVRWVRRALVEAGTQRANELGWPNTYTLTKSISESLIRNYLDANPGAAIAVVRPSIVESSVRQPFAGWNEGVNTSASLSYLLGTFFRQLPTNKSKCLDLIPVDLVTRGMTLIAAALVERRHQPMYQLATSVVNPCDMRRSIELTGLGHRKFYRAQDDLPNRLRLKFDAIPVSKSRYQKLSAPAQKMLIQIINRSLEPIPFLRSPLVRQERELEKVIKLVTLFEPFILHNNHVFAAANIETLDAALPPEERDAFGYDPRAIDWWDYWINVHIPALRKWCYPLIEGRAPEKVARREVRLTACAEPSAAGTANSAPAAAP
ncbi:MAG TPA: SDR family oxidoreductase [Candidatus Dormibacteraeota bacterium]|nr:SDR family oxidoreductase [Candidatus Dormibacteraeota bacterium]